VAFVKLAHRSVVAILFVVGVLFSASIADASGSRLVYGRATGANTCPDEAELRAAVKARLGYDPFFPWADQTVVVQIVSKPNRRVSGKVYVVDVQGHASPEREFTTTVEECHELLLALSLAIVIAVDPLYGTPSAAPAPDKRPPSESDEANRQTAPTATNGSASSTSPTTTPPQNNPPTGPAKPAATDAAFADRGAAARPATPVAIQLGGGPLLGTGLTPGISSGFIPFVRARIGWGSIAVEGRYEVPVWTPSATDRTTVLVWGGAITPCLHWKILGFCGTTFLARYRAEGLDPSTQPDAAFFASAGVRVGAEIPISPGAWAFVRGEGLVNLTRHDLFLAGSRIWQVPPLGVTLSAGAVVSIL